MTKTPGRYVSPKERDHIVTTAYNRDVGLGRAVDLLFRTGLRVAELEGYAAKARVAGDAAHVEVRPQKRNNLRNVPVFAGLVKDPLPSVAAIQKGLQRMGLADGVDFSAHDARHTFLTNAAKECANPFVLMALSGHKDVKSLTRYIHRSEIENTALYSFAYEPSHYDRNVDYYER